MRTQLTGALAASLMVYVAGCGARPAPRVQDPAEPAGMMEVTIDVKGMTKALNIT